MRPTDDYSRAVRRQDTAKRLARICLLILPVLALLALSCTRELQAQVRQPEQPASGPGGAEGSFKVRESTFGSGAKQYWIFEPEPLRGSVPVIAFLHGWGAVVPGPYKMWIEHIVQRGNIVIYPRYQENLREQPPNMIPNAIESIREALSKVGNRADRSKFALVGHSLGAIILFNLAAESSSAGLPSPKAIMSVEPGDTDANPLLSGRVKLVREEGKYNQIPRNILALVVVGDEDKVARDKAAKIQFSGIQQVPCENKNYIVVRSDRHGDPPLIANHFAPISNSVGKEESGTDARGGRRGARRGGILARRRAGEAQENLNDPKGLADALDYYGYWKLFDGLTDAAFYNRNREYALGGGNKQTYMGTWSDGKPVQPLQVSNDPSCRSR